MRRKTGCHGRESVFAAEREADRERETERSLQVREQQTVRERERERGVIVKEREREVNCYNDKRNYIKKIIMRCKIAMREKMIW